MGKALFHDRLFFVLLTATAFFVSGFASTETVDEILEEMRYDIINHNKYHSLKFYYVNYLDGGADFLWKNMESEENAAKLSDDQFVHGEALINLHFGFPFFDLNVTQVVVTKEGTVQSADPAVNWIITPLNTEFEMASCNISYLFQDNNFYVQWNNFRIGHVSFKEYDFSFQVRLSASGEINFVYRRVPYNMMFLQHICDCLENKFGVIYSYKEGEPFTETYELGYPTDFSSTEVVQGTIIRFVIADACMFKKSCESCTETKYHITPNQLERCSWCPEIQRCSSTRDILRQTWKMNNCGHNSVNKPSYCNKINRIISTWFVDEFTVLWMCCIVIVGSLMVIYCCFPRGAIEVVFCCISVEEWLGEDVELVHPTNQQHQPNWLNNQVRNNQNNNQEDQEEQEDEIRLYDRENYPYRIRETSL